MLKNFWRFAATKTKRPKWLLPEADRGHAPWTQRTFVNKSAAGECGNAEQAKGYESYINASKRTVDKLLAAYRDADFADAIAAAPKHVMWTAVGPAALLAAKACFVVVTMDCGDFQFIAIPFVSLYVTAANVWWLTNGGGGCKQSSLVSLQTSIAPTTACALAVSALPPYAGVVVVSLAAFLMTDRLALNDASTLQSWAKSLTLVVNGVAQPCLALVLICSLFS